MRGLKLNFSPIFLVYEINFQKKNKNFLVSETELFKLKNKVFILEKTKNLISNFI